MSRVQRFMWSLYSIAYDVLNSLLPYQEQMEDVINALQLEGSERIIEIGSGTGVLAEKILARYPGVNIKLVEPCPGMMRRARKRLKDAVTYITSTAAEAIDQDPDQYDRVIMVNVLYTQNRKAGTRLIQEAVGHLADSGSVVLSDPKPGSTWWRIMLGHIKSQKGLSLVAQVMSLICTLFLIPELLWVALFNLVIDGFHKRGAYIFRSSEDWRDEFDTLSVEVSSTYAEQNWLVVARKEE